MGYMVNMERILEIILFHDVELIIERKFGNKAKRIIKYLNIFGPKEEKQIANFCMLHVNDAREILYSMLRIDFIRIKNNKQTNSFTNIKKLIFLEFIDRVVKNQVRVDLYQTVINIFSLTYFQIFSQMFVNKYIEISNFVRQQQRFFDY